MFAVQTVQCIPNPECGIALAELTAEDFKYYDKDGFELNLAEQKYYSAMNYPIDYPILNHCCWQEPWFKIEQENTNLILDHSMFLCRCSYTDSALEQLQNVKNNFPQADLLIKTKKKWGFDFALDAVKQGTVYEVLHIEYDNYDFDLFYTAMNNFTKLVLTTDWLDAADKIWQQQDQWQSLQGFEQNHWKANYLIGWSKSEYTEKSMQTANTIE